MSWCQLPNRNFNPLPLVLAQGNLLRWWSAHAKLPRPIPLKANQLRNCCFRNLAICLQLSLVVNIPHVWDQTEFGIFCWFLKDDCCFLLFYWRFVSLSIFLLFPEFLFLLMFFCGLFLFRFWHVFLIISIGAWFCRISFCFAKIFALSTASILFWSAFFIDHWCMWRTYIMNLLPFLRLMICCIRSFSHGLFDCL